MGGGQAVQCGRSPSDGGGYLLIDSCAGGDYWWEPFDNAAQGTGAFESCGSWTGTIQESGTIESFINGSFGNYGGKRPRWSTNLFCRATDHRFTLVKR